MSSRPPEGFVFVDWKDKLGNTWHDCVLEAQIPFLVARGAVIVKVRR